MWCVQQTEGAPTDARARWAAALLVVAAAAQLAGHVVMGPRDDRTTWVVSHVLLVIGAVVLLAAMAVVALVAGPGPGTWLGLVLLVVGQAMTLAVLGIDLDLASVDVGVIRTLDTWDFLSVVGTVVLLLELRRLRGAEPGTDLALLALAVPALDGLVVLAAAAVLVGFAALAHSLLAGRGHGAYAWLTVVTAVGYVVAGTVSWQRAALAVVVVAWTVHRLRAGSPVRVVEGA
jgi:hypothetical protein